MWDWSKNILKTNTVVKQKSLLMNYGDILQPKTGISDYKFSCAAEVDDVDSFEEIVTPSVDEMLEILAKKMEVAGLKNFELKECFCVPQTWKETSHAFREYHHIRKIFLKLVGYSEKAGCVSLGLSKQDIKLLQNMISPENYNTHLKIPLDFGGRIDLDNMCLIKKYPTHEFIHKLIDLQIENNFLLTYKKIYIPYKEGKFYDND